MMSVVSQKHPKHFKTVGTVSDVSQMPLHHLEVFQTHLDSLISSGLSQMCLICTPSCCLDRLRCTLHTFTLSLDCLRCILQAFITSGASQTRLCTMEHICMFGTCSGLGMNPLLAPPLIQLLHNIDPSLHIHSHSHSHPMFLVLASFSSKCCQEEY
jgi:hypothetical protein